MFLLCRKALGYEKMRRFGRGEGMIWMDDVSCTGDENDLSECEHAEYGNHDCSHFEDVGIVCYEETGK